MMQLFTNAYQHRGSVSFSPVLPWLRKRIEENIDAIQAYSQKNALAVTGDHVLAQVIKLTTASSILTEQKVYEQTYVRSPYIGNALKFTSELNKGSTLAHNVYGNRSNIIINNSEYISPYDAVRGWRDLTPLKCLWLDTNKFTLDTPVMTGRLNNELASTSIDIPQLALMFKGFMAYRRSVKETSPEYMVLGEENFVAMYLLPSILKSQADMSILASVDALFRGNYQDAGRAKYPIFIPDYSSAIRTVGTYCLNRITDARMQYVHMLQHLPGLFNESAQQSLVLPDLAPTNQVQWATFTTRLKMINFLLDVGGVAGRKANQGYIGQLQKYVRTLRNATIPYNVMSDEVAAYVDNSIVRILRY